MYLESVSACYVLTSFPLHLWDADRCSRARPVSLDEVPLVGWQQVILHRFYEKIFAGVVVLYQSFFLNDLKTGSTFQSA